MSVFLDSVFLYMVFCLIERVCGELGKIESKKMQRDNACRIQCLSDIALLKKAVYAFSGVRVVTDNADLRALSDSGETLVFSISAGDWITDAV